MTKPDGGMRRLDVTKLDRRILATEAPPTPEERLAQYRESLTNWKLDLYIRTGDARQLTDVLDMIANHNTIRSTTPC